MKRSSRRKAARRRPAFLTGVSVLALLTTSARAGEGESAQPSAGPAASSQPSTTQVGGVTSSSPAGVNRSEAVRTGPPPVAEGRLNPTGRDVQLTAPLREGQFILGEIDFVLGADDRIRVGGPRLLALLRPLLDPGRFGALQTAIADRPEVPAEELVALGYRVSYDPRTISLSVDVPAENRTRRTLSLEGDPFAVVGEFQDPARFSAFLNARGAFSYIHKGVETGFDEPFILLDGAARFRGVVFETEANVEFGGEDGFRREGSRFIYDDRARTARYTLGDLTPINRGFSGTSSMSGLSVLRVYSELEPYRNIQPRGERSFTVVRPSTVEALINGRPVRQLRLQPGAYDARDFPFSQGANDVRLVITDDAGVREVIQFSLFFDRTLLAPGLTEFGLSVGVESPFAGGQRRYTSDPVALGFIRRGLSDRLTAGANFQAEAEGAVAGLEAVWALPIGTVGADVAASYSKELGSGAALALSYQRVFNAGDPRARSLSLTLQTRTENFGTPGTTLDARDPFLYEAGASFSQSLGGGQFLAVDGRYAAGRNGQNDEVVTRALYGRQLSERANLLVEAIHEDRFGRGQSGVRVGLTYRLGRRSVASVDADSLTESVRAGYSTSRGNGVGAWSASADAEFSSDGVGANAAFQQVRNRFEYGVTHTTAFDRSGSEISDQRTSLRGATALVFADGKLALARPVFDGFAIVAPHRSLKGETIVIEPDGGDFEGQSGLFGPAVASNLSAFFPRTVTYDVPGAPPGYDFGTGTFRVFPPYRAGYLVIAGSDYSVTAVGRLIGPGGGPVELVAGRAIELARPERAPITVFTNREGRFGASGLRPGRWRVEMPTTPRSTFILDIPEQAQGVVRLGDLRPEATP